MIHEPFSPMLMGSDFGLSVALKSGSDLVLCAGRNWGMLPPRASPKKSGWLCRDTTHVNVGHDIVARFLAPLPLPTLPYP